MHRWLSEGYDYFLRFSVRHHCSQHYLLCYHWTESGWQWWPDLIEIKRTSSKEGIHSCWHEEWTCKEGKRAIRKRRSCRNTTHSATFLKLKGSKGKFELSHITQWPRLSLERHNLASWYQEQDHYWCLYIRQYCSCQSPRLFLRIFQKAPYTCKLFHLLDSHK